MSDPDRDGGSTPQARNDKTDRPDPDPYEGRVRPSVRLLLVRHAESRNNEVYRDARRLFGGGTPDFDEDGWNRYVDERRGADPGLSERGVRQAERLAYYLVGHLGSQASRPVRVVTSPMRRTLETLLPTLRGLGDGGGGEERAATVIACAFYHESEGCHVRDVPHPGMNRAEIADLLCGGGGVGGGPIPPPVPPGALTFEGFDPNDDAAGWYSHGAGPETRAESEARAAKFYLWLCEHLDSQLREAALRDHGDVYDAGVTRPGEEDELDHDRMRPRRRRRRTCVLFGHGDFMGLVLKRAVAGFGHEVEAEGVPHRSAFVHFNTGITELEYFGHGRFLVMSSNATPHLDCAEDVELKTGGGLKDGWSYLVPDEDFLLDAEVSVAFEDELEGHVREQADALRSLYLGRRSGSNLGGSRPGSRRSSYQVEVGVPAGGGGTGPSADGGGGGGSGRGGGAGGEVVTLVVKRGHQVAGCATLHAPTGRLSDLVVRPSARGSRIGRALIGAAVSRAKEGGGAGRLSVEAEGEEERAFYEGVGFRRVTGGSGGGGDNDDDTALMEFRP